MVTNSSSLIRCTHTPSSPSGVLDTGIEAPRKVHTTPTRCGGLKKDLVVTITTTSRMSSTKVTGWRSMVLVTGISVCTADLISTTSCGALKRSLTTSGISGTITESGTKRGRTTDWLNMAQATKRCPFSVGLFTTTNCGDWFHDMRPKTKATSRSGGIPGTLVILFFHSNFPLRVLCCNYIGAKAKATSLGMDT